MSSVCKYIIIYKSIAVYKSIVNLGYAEATLVRGVKYNYSIGLLVKCSIVMCAVVENYSIL